MEVSFPINKLLKLNITADEFTICVLLNEKKYGLLKDFAKLKGESFYTNIKNLRKEGYIDHNCITNIIPIKEIFLTDKYKKIVSFEDPFNELYNNFPKKVERPDGKTDLLRIKKIKCKIKYSKIIRSNPLLHEHILKCLNYEIKLKEKEGNMGYFKRLYNWLDTKEWEKYEEKLHNITEQIL